MGDSYAMADGKTHDFDPVAWLVLAGATVHAPSAAPSDRLLARALLDEFTHIARVKNFSEVDRLESVLTSHEPSSSRILLAREAMKCIPYHDFLGALVRAQWASGTYAAEREVTIALRSVNKMSFAVAASK